MRHEKVLCDKINQQIIGNFRHSSDLKELDKLFSVDLAVEIEMIRTPDICHSMDLVPLKSLWESFSSSDTSSTTLRPPPTRRGTLLKEDSFPRLRCKTQKRISRVTEAAKGGFWSFIWRRLWVCGPHTECTGCALVTGQARWLSLQLIWLLAQENEFTVTQPSTEKNMDNNLKLL